jgi:transcriptional regulator with XRE-family HTH domain
MAVPGPTTSAAIQQLAANVLKIARGRVQLSQRALAERAGVPQSTVARIESGAMQPTLPMLYRLLIAVDLEPRIRIEPYDDHDDVLDSFAARHPKRQRQGERNRDALLASARSTK